MRQVELHSYRGTLRKQNSPKSQNGLVHEKNNAKNDKMFLTDVTEESVCTLRQKKEGRGHQRMRGWSVGFRGHGSGGTEERDTFAFVGEGHSVLPFFVNRSSDSH